MAVVKTQTVTPLVMTLVDDATFRIWGKWISDTLTSIGFTKTADTGQIDWATVTRPAATVWTYAGYEIRQFPDSLEGTAPVRFKLQFGYGQSAVAPGGYGVSVQIGSGSNGTGTLTGVTTDVLRFGGGNNATAQHIRATGDAAAGWFIIHPGWQDTTNAMGNIFALERSRGSDGTMNGTYVYKIIAQPYNYADSASYCQVLELGVSKKAGCLLQGMTSQSGDYWQPGVLWLTDGYFIGPAYSVIMVPTSFGFGSTVNFTHFGSSHRFVSSSSPTNYGGRNLYTPSANGTIYFAMLWD